MSLGAPATLAVQLTVEELRTLIREEVQRAVARPASASDVLSTDQAAAVAGVSAKTIRAWISEGLPAGRRGRLRTILRADLEKWLAGRRGTDGGSDLLRRVG